MNSKRTDSDDESLGEFQEVFLSLIELLGFISNDEIFKQKHGFSMTEYIALRRYCSKKIREVAGHIERVVRDTGIAKTTGGAAAVVSGASALGGLLLAPFTAGTSLVLTVGGIAVGVASAATSLTAAIIQDRNVKSAAKEVKSLLDSLAYKDKVVGEVVQELQEMLKKMRALYGKRSVMDFIKDGVKIGKWIGYNIAYKGYKVYSSVKAIMFARMVANIIKADISLMRGVAVNMAAPGFGMFGRALFLAGSSTAKIISSVFSVLGIGFGIWDIVDGAKDIRGSEHARAYRKAADELEQQTASYKTLLEKIQVE